MGSAARNSPFRFLSLATALALALFLTSFVNANAQAGAANGSISGTVYDSGKHVVPGVKITAINLDTGFSRTVTSNDSGDYALPLLPLGNYSVTVEKAGFSRLIQTGITVEPQRSTLLPLVLAIASSQRDGKCLRRRGGYQYRIASRVLCSAVDR